LRAADDVAFSPRFHRRSEVLDSAATLDRKGCLPRRSGAATYP